MRSSKTRSQKPSQIQVASKARARAAWTIKNPHAAGIDLGARRHYVAVAPDAVAEHESFVRDFGPFTEDLQQMVEWFKACGVTTVAMESTGVDWVPVYRSLAGAGLEVILVNTKQMKHAPQRKTDVMGETGQRILQAILGGERDPDRLLKLRDDKITLSAKAQMRAALLGDYRPEQLFVIGQACQSFRFAHQQVEATDLELAKLLELMAAEAARRRQASPPPAEASAKPPAQPGPKKAHQSRKRNDPKVKLEPLLTQVFGIDLTQVLGFRVLGLLTLLSEVGFDLGRFPNAKAFASWLGLCPNNKISGGKVLNRRTKHVVNRLSIFLRMSAVALGRTETTLGWFYRRKRAQLGPAGAATATARKLACLVYYLIKNQEAYLEPDLAAHQLQYNQRRRTRLIKQIEELGYAVTLQPKKEKETLQICE